MVNNGRRQYQQRSSQLLRSKTPSSTEAAVASVYLHQFRRRCAISCRNRSSARDQCDHMQDGGGAAGPTRRRTSHNGRNNHRRSPVVRSSRPVGRLPAPTAARRINQPKNYKHSTAPTRSLADILRIARRIIQRPPPSFHVTASERSTTPAVLPGAEDGTDWS